MDSLETQKFSLRRAQLDDALTLYNWQAHPDTRRYFRNTELFSFESHVDWLTKKLADNNCLLHLILLNGQPVGNVRLDCLDFQNKIWEIAILVSPDFYQKGVGRAGLELARNQYPEYVFKAEVKKENIASLRLFESCGYVFENGYFYSYPRSK